MTTWTPDTDPEAKIRLARGAYEVWFDDGRTDPKVVGFETLAEAESFIARSPKAVGRPHHIVATGTTIGEPMEFVPGRASKVHATVDAVVDENRTKNLIAQEIERIAPGVPYRWQINPDDRQVEIVMEDATPEVKTRVQTEMADAKTIGGRLLNLRSRTRVI